VFLTTPLTLAQYYPYRIDGAPHVHILNIPDPTYVFAYVFFLPYERRYKGYLIDEL